MNLEKVDDFLTVKELSKWIKLSESHIYFLVNKRKIPFAKLGGKLLFDKEKIKEWIDNNSPSTPPAPQDEAVEQLVEQEPSPEQSADVNLIPTDIDVPQENLSEAVEISNQEAKFENQVGGE
jgi:excisionase family DNA binding protein